MPEGVAEVAGTDIGSGYYDSAVGTVELQIAKGKRGYSATKTTRCTNVIHSGLSPCSMAQLNRNWRDRL